jgi:PEP-CTERM motif
MPTARNSLAAALILLLATSASVKGGPLLVDANAMPGFQGFQDYLAVIPATVSGRVEYAVYAPGMFDLSYPNPAMPGADPSNGTEWVYAYQVYNTGTAADLQITGLTVGLDALADPHSVGILNPLYGDNGKDPDSSFFSPSSGPPLSSTRWSYTGAATRLFGGAPGEHSEILLFTSPHPPTYRDGGILGGAAPAPALLPSPVPEPGTIVLFAVGAMILAAARRRGAPLVRN